MPHGGRAEGTRTAAAATAAALSKRQPRAARSVPEWSGEGWQVASDDEPGSRPARARRSWRRREERNAQWGCNAHGQKTRTCVNIKWVGNPAPHSPSSQSRFCRLSARADRGAKGRPGGPAPCVAVATATFAVDSLRLVPLDPAPPPAAVPPAGEADPAPVGNGDDEREAGGDEDARGGVGAAAASVAPFADNDAEAGNDAGSWYIISVRDEGEGDRLRPGPRVPGPPPLRSRAGSEPFRCCEGAGSRRCCCCCCCCSASASISSCSAWVGLPASMARSSPSRSWSALNSTASSPSSLSPL
jgi:hypothetical protein